MSKQKSKESPSKAVVTTQNEYISGQVDGLVQEALARLDSKARNTPATSSTGEKSSYSETEDKSMLKEAWATPVGKVLIIGGSVVALAWASKYLFRIIGDSVIAFNHMKQAMHGRAA